MSPPDPHLEPEPLTPADQRFSPEELGEPATVLSSAAMRRRDDPRMRTVEMAAISVDDLRGASGVLTRRQTMLLVAGGGAVGALLRYVLLLLIPATFTPTLVEFPWATGIANVVGCLAIGVVAGLIETAAVRARWVQPFFATGVCGGFTTFSTMVLHGSAMIGADFPVQALEYVGSTVALSVIAVVAGLILGRRAGPPTLRWLRERRRQGDAGSHGRRRLDTEEVA